jgi:hypothetical protein
MAQTGYTPIVLYNTATAAATPTAGNLLRGELALNVVDKKIYSKDNSGVVIQVGSGPDAVETLTNKTLTSPVINNATGGFTDMSVSGTATIDTANTQALTVSGVPITGGPGGLAIVEVTGTSVTAVNNNLYVLQNVAATTVTLPATPINGETVGICTNNSLTTNVIARGGNTIMGLAEDMTLDNANATVTLRYLASTWRLV